MKKLPIALTLLFAAGMFGLVACSNHDDDVTPVEPPASLYASPSASASPVVVPSASASASAKPKPDSKASVKPSVSVSPAEDASDAPGH